MTGHVFVSYSRRDSGYVEHLVGELEERGFGVWIDRSAEPGSEWITAIKAAIESCAVFVPVMTESSEQSQMVMLEVLHAMDLKKPMLPLLLSGRRWFLLRAVQDEDVRGSGMPSEVWFAQLTQLIERDGPAKLRTGTGNLTPVATFLGHSRRVRAVAWSPDGRVVASGSEDCRVLVRDAATGGIQRRTEKHADWVCAVAWSPTGQRLASAGGEHQVFVSEGGGQERSILSGHTANVLSIAWSGDGRHIASAGADGTVLVHPASGGEPRVLTGHGDRVFSVSWSRSDQLASGSADGTVRLWDPFTGQERGLLPHEAQVRAVAWSPDASQIAVASADPAVRVWEPYGEIVMARRDFPGKALSLAWSAEGQLLAIGCDDGTVRVWSLRTDQEVVLNTGNTGSIRAVAWTPSRPRALATGGEDGAVRIWRLGVL